MQKVQRFQWSTNLKKSHSEYNNDYILQVHVGHKTDVFFWELNDCKHPYLNGNWCVRQLQ